MNTLKRFIDYYKPYKSMFFMDMFCALTLSMIDLIFPLIVRYLLNDIYVNKSSSEIIHFIVLIGIGLLIMYIIRYFCQYYISSWGHIMGARMEADMREDIFLHLQKQSFSYYDNTNTGQLMSRIVNDLFDISELAHHGPEDVFISLLKIFGSFIILMKINVKITSVLFFITLFMIYFSYFYNKKMKYIFKKNRVKIASVNSQIQDSLAGIRVVKSFSNEDLEVEKFKNGNNEYLQTKEKGYFIMGKFFSGNGFFQGMLYLSVILVGGILIGTGEAQASDLVVYILYINIFLNPIEKLVNFTEQFQKGITGFERFLEILNTKPEIEDVPGSIDLKNPKGEIEFKDVTFSYDAESTVLEGINIKIEKGKTVALVGSSGSGKTTLCNLIPRFY
ncbi:ATP-binding cassette domain-containing protein, partial [Bacteroidales bacterium MSK.15.36]|nr:ATP-binding cassette domain-containing protein [Bacteroidales bacterium MSK.15.36]